MTEETTDGVSNEELQKKITADVTTALTSGHEFPKNDEQEKSLVSMVAVKYQKWAKDRQERERRWEVYYNNYRQVLPSSHKWRSKIFDPSTFQAVESILPSIMEALLPSNDFYEARAKSMDNVPSEPSIKALLDHQLENAKHYEKYSEIIKTALIYGTAFAKIPFREEWAVRRNKRITFANVLNPLTGRTQKVKKKKIVEGKRERVFYGPDIEPVDIWDIFTDNNDPELNELIHVTRRPLSYLRDRAKEGVFINVERVQPDRGREGQDSSDTGIFRQQQEGVNSEEDEVTLKTFWGLYDLEDNGDPEPVQIVIANDKIVLLAEPNPYWHGKPPFIYSPYVQIPKELYGIGVPEAIQSTQRQINDMINQRNDNVSLVLNRMWLVSSLIDIDLSRLSSVPGRFIQTSDINGIKPLETPDVTASAYNEVTLMKSAVEQATGFSNFAAGLDSGKTLPRAARTVTALTSASLQKFGMTVKLFERKLVQPTLDMFLSLDQQFLDDLEYIRVTNEEKPDVMEFDPNTLRGDYTFVTLGATEMLTKEQQIQSLLTFLSVAQQDPSIDRRPIFQKLWKLLGQRDPLPEFEVPPQGVEGAETTTGQLQNSGTLQLPTTPQG